MKDEQSMVKLEDILASLSAGPLLEINTAGEEETLKEVAEKYAGFIQEMKIPLDSRINGQPLMAKVVHSGDTGDISVINTMEPEFAKRVREAYQGLMSSTAPSPSARRTRSPRRAPAAPDRRPAAPPTRVPAPAGRRGPAPRRAAAPGPAGNRWRCG